jgi:hypothetical protein
MIRDTPELILILAIAATLLGACGDDGSGSDAGDTGTPDDTGSLGDGSSDTAIRDAPPPIDSGGSVVDAASCEQADVEDAIGRASVGDTVAVPAGTCTWSGLTLDHAIHLRGAGTDATIITVADVSVRKRPDGVTRISGFGFEKTGGGNESKGFVVGGSWRDAQPVVFQDCRFTISGTGLFRLNVAGGVIIARSEFTGEWDDSFIQPKDSGDSDGSWTSADTMGMRDADGTLNHYVEDNTFTGGTNQGIDADDATRVVYRHNTLTYSSFNTHGLATSSDGVRHFEVYENEFIHDGGETMLANQNWLIWIRGGTGVIWGNTFADIAGSYWGDKAEIQLTIRGAEDARPQGDCADVSYPVPRQLGQSHDGSNPITDPIYIWGNTGASEVAADWNWGNPCGLTFDDFFQWGRDAYDDGTERPDYAPFTYPHPLVL